MTKASASRKRLNLLAFALLSTVVLACFCGVIAPLFVSQVWAELLTPPPYPNSRLVAQGEGGGIDVRCHGRTYESVDNLDQVLAHMERYMPNFSADLESGKLRHYNSLQDESWLASRFASGNKMLPTPPSVQVWLRALNDDGTGTQIKISACWAAP